MFIFKGSTEDKTIKEATKALKTFPTAHKSFRKQVK